jgi:hypothetical protein
MRITVIVPTHRGPAELLSIARAFALQRHADKRLVVVENGAAIGICKRHGIHADAVLASEHSKSHALNTGLTWLRAHGGGAWTGWDDDDYYGPGYLQEVAERLPGCDVLGKRSIYVRRNDGRLWLARRSGWPLGHSFSAWSDCHDFEQVPRWGEDDSFLRRMLRDGARLGEASPEHFVWQRCGDLSAHIWPADDDQMTQLLARQDDARAELVDYGEVANYAFVDRLAHAPIGRHVAVPAFDPLNVPGISPAFRSTVARLEAQGLVCTPDSAVEVTA